MPRVSPLPTWMSTCCTALTMPRRVVNSTVRSLTSSSGCAVTVASTRAGRHGKIWKTTPCKVPAGRNRTESEQSSRPPLRIDDVAQAIAEQVEAEHRNHQREAGKERDPPFARHHEACALGDHDAPFGRRRPHAKADEGEARRIEDGI